jgi:predicted house-cleaning noncanonical NTP pyrophosphatase (MazG superfamily)
MSEYPIGLNGEMIHCLDDSPYAEYCRNKLEKEIEEDLEEKEK